MGNTELSDFGNEGGGESGEGPDEGTIREEAEVVAGDTDPVVNEIVTAEADALPDADGELELMVTQVDYTVEGSGDSERPVLHVFGRTEDDDAEHVRVHGFRPYFYAPTGNLDEDDLTDDVITGHEDGYESIRGEPLTKIFGRTPRDVGNVRDQFDHYEADILFPNRLLIDKDITSGVRVPDRRADDGALYVHHDELEACDVAADLRVNTFDIEVDDRSGFPEDGEEPVVCLTSHDSYRDEYVAWLYEAPEAVAGSPDDLADHDLLDETADVDVRTFEREEAMHEAFLSYVEETDPDVLTGWNFDDFDAPYLIDRLDELDPYTDYDLDSDRLSRVEEVWTSGWGGPNVKGRVVFDLLYAYQRMQRSELDSYRLDAVGEVELGVGKERYPGDIGDLWEDDPKRLLEYNLRDVELCVEIDRKENVVPFWDEARKLVGSKLEDATTPGDAVDMYVLHKAYGNFVLPSKGQQEAEEFEGGAVFDPITGVKENVSVLDLKCFSGDTDVLTPEGSRNIRDVEPGDPVYTLDPETFECAVKPVAETHQYENGFGELHHLRGNTHDLKVTENHRFLVSKERGWDDQTPGDFEFAEYRQIPENERFAFPQHDPVDGEAPDSFDLVDDVEGGNVVVYFDDDLRAFRSRMPEPVVDSLNLVHGSSEALGIQKTVGKYLIPVSVYRDNRDVIEEQADEVFLKYDAQHRETPLSFEMMDWLEFLGWFVTEGSIDRAANRFTIHQQDEENREAISDLLDRMGVNYNVDERGVNVSNEYLLSWLEDNCGAECEDKQLPGWMFDLDGRLLSVVLDTMIRGDGSRADSGLGKFWTKSESLKDAAVDLAVRCGHKPTVSKQADGTWYVSVGKRGSFEKSTNATVEEHDGQVYCITAKDNHVVLAGRNGHFQWVGQSLYPMSMVTINASPETKVDPDDYDGVTYRTPTGVHFRKEPDGIIREMVNELLAEREEKKSLRDEHDPDSETYGRYDRQQAAVKVIMNSLYGVFGWDRFRLYDREMSAGVTSTNREVISFTEDAANGFGYEVAYGDTDSVMLELGPDLSKDEAIEESFDIADHINDAYDEFASERLHADEHRFEIEFEKLYRRFFQAGKKKRYAGHIVWKEGKDVDDVDITGFEYQRSDIAPITKEVQKEVIDLVVREGDVDAVEEYVHGVIEDFREGNVDLDDVGIPGGIGKRLDNYDTDTAQVRGAKYANLLLGTNFDRGSKPKRLYLEKVHPDFFRELEAENPDLRDDPLYVEFKTDHDVICYDYADQLPEEFEVDYDVMLDKTLKGPIERILEALDVSWEEVKNGQTQTGLGNYM